MAGNVEQTGIVYLVGAGPGHPGLITRWGYELLQKCDAVAYDALIPMELISGLPEGVEKYYVGKRAGRHSLPQSQINELLVTLAKRGLNVVRLKGGDPFIFGRIGEEAKHLSDAGVPVVMVPGVTAASAVAAMSGFSLTSRQESSWIFIATGHPAENTSTPVPWDRVASLQGGTLVIYMGIARLESIVEKLLASGMAPDTPAVAVQAASTGLQRSVQAPLNTISSECLRRHLKPPALIIIGEPVRYQTYNYSTKDLVLTGKRVLLTSPSQISINISASLREAGAQPLPYPTAVCRRFTDDKGWEDFLKILDSGGICLFSREVDVHYFFNEARNHGVDMRGLAPFKMVVSGENVKNTMVSLGIFPDYILPDLKTETLLECLSELVPDASLPLIRICGNQQAFIPEDPLKKRCSGTMPLAVSEETTTVWDPRWKDELSASPPDFIVFTGTCEVKGFVELLGADTACDLARRSCVVATDAAVSDMLQEYEIPCSIQLVEAQNPDLIEALARYAKDHAVSTD